MSPISTPVGLSSSSDVLLPIGGVIVESGPQLHTEVVGKRDEVSSGGQACWNFGTSGLGSSYPGSRSDNLITSFQHLAVEPEGCVKGCSTSQINVAHTGNGKNTLAGPTHKSVVRGTLVPEQLTTPLIDDTSYPLSSLSPPPLSQEFLCTNGETSGLDKPQPPSTPKGVRHLLEILGRNCPWMS